MRAPSNNVIAYDITKTECAREKKNYKKLITFHGSIFLNLPKYHYL